MVVRDIIKAVYDGGELDDLVDRFSPQWRAAVRARILESMEPYGDGEDRCKAVVIPYKSDDVDLVCMFRRDFMKRFVPTCEMELKLLEEDIDQELRSYLCRKVAPSLLLSHNSLLQGWKFGPGAFDLLLEAEVPEPLDVDKTEFVKAFLREVGGIPRSELTNGMVCVRIQDPVAIAIIQEKALRRAYDCFSRTGPAPDPGAVKELKDLYFGETEPILVKTRNGEVLDRVKEQLLIWATAGKQKVGMVSMSALDTLSPQRLEELCRKDTVLLSDLFMMPLLPEAEEALVQIAQNGARLVLLAEPGEDDLFFENEALWDYFGSFYEVYMEGMD